MNEPLVSVKMLTYNHAPYIAQAIEGVLMQKTDFPFELVIGEDCSTDGTREIVFDYARRYPEIIHLVTSEKNVGAAQNSARVNAALRGKYIAWCEGDDYWTSPEKLQKQIAFLENHPDHGMVHSSADFLFQSSGKVIKNYNESQNKFSTNNSQNLLEQIILGQYPVNACTVVYRKKVWEEHFNLDELIEKKFLMGDVPLWAAIAAHSQIHYIPESLATYRRLDESMSHSKNKKKSLKYWISSAEMRLYLCQKYNLPEWIHKLQEKKWRRLTLQLAFLDKSPELADRVRQQYPGLSYKEWIWYQGVKHPMLRPLVIVLQLLFQKKT